MSRPMAFIVLLERRAHPMHWLPALAATLLALSKVGRPAWAR